MRDPRATCGRYLGTILLKDPRNAEWLDVQQICRICRERYLLLNGRVPTPNELEATLRKLFEQSDEVCVNGISVTGYSRRVGWDLIFMLRFYPDVHSSSINLLGVGTEEPQLIQNN